MLNNNGDLKLISERNKEQTAQSNAKLLEYVRSANTKEIQSLLQENGHRISSDIKNTALRHTIKKEDVPCTILLLEHSKKKTRGIALIIAAEKGIFPIVTLIMDKYKEDILDEDIEYALSGASEKGHTKIADWLLKHFGKKAISNEAKCFSLINAVKENHISILKIFLQKCINDFDNPTLQGALLILAAERGHTLAIIMLLHKFNEKISSVHKGESLIKAVEGQHLSALSILLRKCGPQITDPYKTLAYKKALEMKNNDDKEQTMNEKCLNLLTRTPATLIHHYKNSTRIKNPQLRPSTPYGAPFKKQSFKN